MPLAEAARLCGLNAAYLRQLCVRGRLKAKKVGRDWLTTRADLRAYLESRETRGNYRPDVQIKKGH